MRTCAGPARPPTRADYTGCTAGVAEELIKGSDPLISPEATHEMLTCSEMPGKASKTALFDEHSFLRLCGVWL